MRNTIESSLLTLLLVLTGYLPAFAQEPPTSDDDNASERVEESDEEFRRRMELEDARHRDPGYTPPASSPQKKQEKIDKLPPESRDNIHDQLVDIIMENGEWEPADALEDYPYEPTEAARQDGELMDQEQAAWDEQIEKYHAREAEAFGAPRSAAGPMGSAGKEAGAGEDSGAAGGPQGGTADEAGRAGSAGSYSPYASDRRDEGDEPATAGAQQSALDFLRQLQGQEAVTSGATSAATSATIASEMGAAEEAGADQASVLAASRDGADRQSEADSEAQTDSESESESEAESASDTAREIPGIIAIEDLDKLEGTGTEDEPDDSGPPN